MDKIKVCIVGLGWTGANHYAGYAAIPEKAEVVACVARSAAAQAKAQQWGIPKIYKSFDAALQDTEIDAFSLCTPHYDHAPMLVAALQAGKHVIGETPACMTLAECRQLRIALFDYPNLTAATGHICRSWPTFAHAKREPEFGATFANALLIFGQLRIRKTVLFFQMFGGVLAFRAKLRVEFEGLEMQINRHVATDVRQCLLKCRQANGAPWA